MTPGRVGRGAWGGGFGPTARRYPDPVADDAKQTRDDFSDAVNMTPKELGDWLETDESKAVGQKSGGSGSAPAQGPAASVRAVGGGGVLLLTENDLAHMSKVTGYVKWHLAQEPMSEAIEDSTWRYSLMNWGHDPLKKQ
ncbi:MAG: putative DNA-binding protein [Modestobacter sp.]|nr:putative DNA-binding protein [Modestobacter sp.]